LVTALANAHPPESAAPLGVLLQVSLDDSVGRGGAVPTEVPALAGAVLDRPELALRGVMAVAPLDAEPGPAFERLAEIAARLRAEHPAATIVSAGMSADLEAAVTFGATHLRIGSALLGNRAPLR
jgi:uncharacterized pyridoxal phosphate-containing UPF0001 family protein